MEKKYRTRSGLPTRIICTDRKAPWPVIALINYGTQEDVEFYTSDLTIYSLEDSTKQNHELDLVEVQPYEDFKLGVYQAVLAAAPDVAALVEALEGLLKITDESLGVSGYHLNGNMAKWCEFEEVEIAEKALALYHQQGGGL